MRVILVAFLCLSSCAMLPAQAIGQDADSDVTVMLAGEEGDTLYPEKTDEEDEEYEALRAIKRSFYIIPTDPTQSFALVVSMKNTGSQTITICADGHHFWDFISFEAARLVEIQESDIGEDEYVFSTKGDTYYRIAPVPEATFSYELVQKAFLTKPGGLMVFSEFPNGAGTAVPEGDVIAREDVFGIIKPAAVTIETTNGVVRLPATPPMQCFETVSLFQVSLSP